MLKSLVRMVREMGIQALAEGMETEAEARTCIELGFDLHQGYFYGEPAAWDAELLGVATRPLRVASCPPQPHGRCLTDPRSGAYTRLPRCLGIPGGLLMLVMSAPLGDM